MRPGGSTSYSAHAAVTDRENVEPASDWLAGRPEPPRQCGRIGANVGWAVLCEDVACRRVIEELLSSVAQRLPPLRILRLDR